MKGFEEYLVQFLPRLNAMLSNPAITAFVPKNMPDGVRWCVTIPPSMAMTILEGKNDLRTLTLNYVEGNAKVENVLQSGDIPQLGYIIEALLTKIKDMSPFMEPRGQDGVVSCRTYKDIIGDLCEEYVKTTKEFKDVIDAVSKDPTKAAAAKDILKRMTNAKGWTSLKERLFQIIRDSRVDPIRKSGDGGDTITYGMSYEGETPSKKQVKIYLKFIEKRGCPTVMQWGEEKIVCHDPRLKEMAAAALTAFKCRIDLPKLEADKISNFLAAYFRQLQQNNSKAAGAGAANVRGGSN